MIAQNIIKQWINEARDIFCHYMPNAQNLMNNVKIVLVSEKRWRKVRSQIVIDILSDQIDVDDTVMFETIHGKLGTVILLRQKFVREYYEFCKMLWHEMGHAYGIEYECPSANFIRFNAPGLADERAQQEGYWLWQEFIAESISNYVHNCYNSKNADNHIIVLSQGQIEEHLRNLIIIAFQYFQYTMDEKTLGIYYATILMDKDIINVDVESLYILHSSILHSVDKKFHKALNTIMDILKEQVTHEQFWRISSDTLERIGEQLLSMNTIKTSLIMQGIINSIR